MPISVVIYLIPPEDVTLRPTMGHHAHAVLLSLLRIGNPEKAEEVHATSRQKPFTVSPLIGDGERRGDFLRIRAGTECWLRYTFLDDALFAHFGNAFLTQGLPSIRLGGATFQLSRLVASGAETNDWSGTKTYEELMESAGTDTRLRVRFHSPTAFRELSPRGEKRGIKRILISCVAIRAGLTNGMPSHRCRLTSSPFSISWHDHAGLTAVESRSRMLDFGKHKEIGFVGSCAYQFFVERQSDGKEGH